MFFTPIHNLFISVQVYNVNDKTIEIVLIFFIIESRYATCKIIILRGITRMNIKCPKCGGTVVFDPETGKMKCNYCDRLTGKENFSSLDGISGLQDSEKPSFSLKQEASAKSSETEEHTFKLKDSSIKISPKANMNTTPTVNNDSGDFKSPGENNKTPVKNSFLDNTEYMEMNIYHCSSCGANLMVGGTQASTFCSYCGSPSIVFDRVSKEMRPSKIIPFKLTEEQALNRIKEQFRKGSYIPSKIKALNVDSVRAIYIPFWLYTSYIRKNMVITARTNDGTYIYNRNVSCTYENISLDASLKLSNDMSKRLEPYNMNDLEDFDVAYLSGFYADMYDVPYDALENEAHKRCRDFLETEIFKTCPHANRISSNPNSLSNYKVSDEQEDYRLENVEYALLPAYFVNIQYGSSRKLVIVNGQTGKVVGNLPFEKDLFVRKFIKNSIISCTIFSLISVLIFRFPAMMPVFFVLGVLDAVLIGTGISSYKKYKFGLQQLASRQMTSYVNRMEDI